MNFINSKRIWRVFAVLFMVCIFVILFWQSKTIKINSGFTPVTTTDQTSDKAAALIESAKLAKEEQKIIDLKMEETKSSAKYAPLLFSYQKSGEGDNSKLMATGTSAYNLDTDGDGVTDGEELDVYHTDPKKADTDGDSYPDGDEIRNGHNPLVK